MAPKTPAKKPPSRKAAPAPKKPTPAAKAPPKRGKAPPAAPAPEPQPAAVQPPAPASSAEPGAAGGELVPGGMLAIPIHVSRIVASRFNVPHRDPDPETVESIREHGNFQPIVVRPIDTIGTRSPDAPILTAKPAPAAPIPAGVDFEIVLGECRWKACGLVDRPVLAFVQRLTDDEAMTLQCEENLRRKDLTPIQEAVAFAHFLAQLGGDLEATARKVRKSVAHVAGRLKLAELPLASQQALQAGEIRLGTALEIACLLTEADRVAALPLVMPPAGEEAITVREARDRITARFHLRMVGARFPLNDADLVPAAGPCTKCPKRTTNQMALFGESMRPDDRCMDRACWQTKTEAQWTRQSSAASSAGVAILDTRAEDKAGQRAKMVLYHPQSAGLLDLDTECDVLIQNQIEEAQGRLARAEADKDDAAIATIGAEIEQLETAEAPTWRAVLGDAVPLAAIGRSEEHSGRTDVHELVSDRAAYEAIKAQGHPIPPWMARRLEQPDRKDEPKPEPPSAEELAAIAEEEIGRRADKIRSTTLIAAIVNKAEDAAARPDPAFWRGLILATIYAIFSFDARQKGDMGDLEPMAKRRAWHTDDEQTMADVVIRETSRLSQQKLRGVLLEIVCAGITLQDAASLGRHLGLDTGAIWAEAEKQAREELAAAKKKAPKKKRGASSADEAQETAARSADEDDAEEEQDDTGEAAEGDDTDESN